jgi:hypothetical protein
MPASPGGRTGPGRLAGAAIVAGTLLVIIATALLPLLTTPFLHPALDAAGSPARLGLPAGLVYALSDRSVEELVLGPGTFAFDGPDGSPFYGVSERSHLAEARLLLWLCLLAGALSLLAIGGAMLRSDPPWRRSAWRIIARTGAATAVAVVVLGLLSLVAFDALFTLFHQVFFPAGNWSFDPATQRLVQLYPFRFWQIAAGALGLLVLLLGVLAWWLGRRLGRETAGAPAVAAAVRPDSR